MSEKKGRGGRPRTVDGTKLLTVAVSEAFMEELRATAARASVAGQPRLPMSELVRLAVRLWFDSPGDMVRALAEDPDGVQLVIRSQASSSHGVGREAAPGAEGV